MTSVVVPVYNGAHVLGWSVPSVLALQDVAEVVYVDDGSTDDTHERLAELIAGEPGVRVLHLTENCGRAAARNAGADIAAGSTLVFLDADVRPSSDLVARFAEALGAPGAVATVARLTFDGLGDEPYHDYLRHHPRGVPDVAPGTPVPWKHFVTTACAVARAAFDAAGGFDTRVAYGEDLALACALSLEAPRGLVASGVDAQMTDVGTLATALDKVAEFGRSLPELAETCPGVYGLAGLSRLVHPSIALRVASSAPVARLVQASLGRLPLSGRVRAVRYLLGQSLLHAHSDAVRIHPRTGR